MAQIYEYIPVGTTGGGVVIQAETDTQAGAWDVPELTPAQVATAHNVLVAGSHCSIVNASGEVIFTAYLADNSTGRPAITIEYYWLGFVDYQVTAQDTVAITTHEIEAPEGMIVQSNSYITLSDALHTAVPALTETQFSAIYAALANGETVYIRDYVGTNYTLVRQRAEVSGADTIYLTYLDRLELIYTLDNNTVTVTFKEIGGSGSGGIDKNEIVERVTVNPTATEESADFIYNSSTRKLFFKEVYLVDTYTITPTLSHVTASADNPATIDADETATLVFTAATGYGLPDSVTVTGATFVWTKATGTLVLSNPTANVTFSISGLAVYNITPTLSHVTASGGNPTTIQENGTATLVFTAATGYELPDNVTVTGATGGWTKSTGTLVLSNPTANVTFTITGILPQLATPTNLTASGTTISFDPVENATSYEVYADGVSIGEEIV